MFRTIAVMICCVGATLAQSRDRTLTFEAAAIKPSPPKGDGRLMIGIEGGPGTAKPGQMNFYNVSIGDMIQNAWEVRSFQVSGPDWLQQVRFDIQAKVPPASTRAQARVMLQNLLADRFRLVLHHSTRESSIYGLLVAKSGSKLKDAATGADVTPGRRMITMAPGGKMKMLVDGATITQFIDMLALQLDRPVIDLTNLTGSYDITLEFAPDTSIMAAKMAAAGLMPPPPGPDAGDPNGGATLFSALTEQLGLRLDARKGPLDMLVIDAVEKTPTEN